MRLLMIAVAAGLFASACSTGDKVIGTYGGALTGLDDPRTCSVDQCASPNLHSAAASSYADGGIDQTAPENDSWPVDPCNYYPNPVLADGGVATDGEWSVADPLGNDVSIGFDFEATYEANPTPIKGHVENKTCVPSPLRGAGSYPPDGCGWKYQCVPSTGGQ
ncbi:MAG: hypothetical protein ABI183_00670 [Polyangiaceae bacterium]